MRLQEIALQSRPSTEHDVLIAQDAGVAKARRVMAQLLAAEAAATPTTAPGAGETRYAASAASSSPATASVG